MTSLNRRAALAATGTGLATALTVALTASVEPAPESPIGEAAHEKARRLAKELAHALKEWTDEDGGIDQFWAARVSPVGRNSHPVQFDKIDGAPIDWSMMERVDLYAVRRAADEYSSAVDAHVTALKDAERDPSKDELATQACHAEYEAFRQLLSIRCRSFSDVEAKARALLGMRDKGGYHIEPDDAETLLRSIIGEGRL